MKLSLVLELLIISGLIAYGASRNVAEPSKSVNAITAESNAPKQAEFELEIGSPVAAQLDNSVSQPEEDIDDDLSSEEDEVVEEAAESAPEAASAVEEEVAEVADDQVAAAAEPAAVVQAAVPAAVAIANNNTVVNQNDPNPINRYCTCAAASCKCCRDFSLPIVPIRGPGCATLKYLEDDKMLVTVKYGDIVLTSRTISGRKATPICIPLPGGYSRFCGRVYGISRKEENFKACLGLELRAEDEIEAALRVSCFQFGPRGLTTTEAEPLPPVIKDETDDDDDDDDLFGLAGGLGDDDDDDDDDEEGGGGLGIFDGGNGVPAANGEGDTATAIDDDDDDDDEEVDLGFSLLGGNLLDDIFAPTTTKPASAVQSGPVKATLYNPPTIKYVPNRTGPAVNKVSVVLPTNKMPTKSKKKPAAASLVSATNRMPPKTLSKESDSISQQSSSSSGQSGMLNDLADDLQEQREDFAEEQQDALEDLRGQGEVEIVTARPKVSRTKKASSSGNGDPFGFGYFNGLLNWLT